MKLRRQARAPGWYEIMSACPICGSKGWCAIDHEQTVVHCMRVPSDDFFDSHIGRQFRHYLDPDKRPKSKPEIILSDAVEKKSNDHLNWVYRALLKELPLSEQHFEHLLSDRLMYEDAISYRQYRTMIGPERYKVVKSLIQRLTDQEQLLGVPGFFTAEGKYGPYWTMSGQAGLMIPFRSIRNEIIGWQIRVDVPPLELKMKGSIKGEVLEELPATEAGYRRAKCSLVVQDKTLEVILTEKDEKVCHSSSGKFVFSVELKQGQKYWWWSSSSKKNGSGIGGPLPYHLALPYQCLQVWDEGETANTVIDCSEVWITEGPIKADKAADALGKPVFGIPGAGAFGLVLEPLIELGCKHVVLAFDADVVTTPEVEMALRQCADFIAEKTNMALSLAIWDISLGKGIDDLTDNGYIPHISKMLE